jgi:cell wall-associated NlpC family hydrolase
MRSTTASEATSASPRRMRSMRVRTSVFVVGVVALASFIALPAVAPAATLADKQAQAAALDREVSKLEDRFGDLQERWRGALVELQEIQADRRDAERKLTIAKRDLRSAKDRLRERAIAIYRDGSGSSELLQVAEADTLQEFFERLETIQRVGTQDADILGRVRDAAERVEKQAALGSVTADIRAIMAAQRAAAAAADARDARANAQTVSSGGTLEDAADPSTTQESGDDGGSSEASSFVPLPPASGSAAAAASIAMGKSGSPYEYGAAGPSTFDCSGLVVWAFAQAGRPGLPHSTYSLIGMGVEVPMDQAQVGDLVFTNNAGHMGIYVGGGSFVHAPRTGRTVTVEGLGNYSVVSIRRI